MRFIPFTRETHPFFQQATYDRDCLTQHWQEPAHPMGLGLMDRTHQARTRAAFGGVRALFLDRGFLFQMVPMCPPMSRVSGRLQYLVRLFGCSVPLFAIPSGLAGFRVVCLPQSPAYGNCPSNTALGLVPGGVGVVSYMLKSICTEGAGAWNPTDP